MNYRKTLLAAVLAVPLALTACGSDEESADSTASATVTESSATSTDKPDEDKDNKDEGNQDDNAEESERNNPEGDHAEGEQGDNADRPAGDGGSNNAAGRNEGGNNPAPAPAPGGGGGNNADKEAITNLVNGMDDGGDNMQALAYYTLDNSCTAYINSQGGAATLRTQADAMVNAQGQPLTFTEVGRVTGNPGVTMAKIQKVENIRVNGDTATAYVTSDQAASEMQFAREGGKWKICPAS